MEFLACFKMAPDLDMLFGSNWTMDSRFWIDIRYMKTSVNPYDESALELLLKLRDDAARAGTEVELSALTIGPDSADRMLKTLYALKYDHASRIACDLDLRFNAPFVAGIIERYVRRIGNAPVIVMGDQTSEGNNLKTPLLVAESLGIPCITAVTGIRLSAKKDCLDVVSKMDTLVVKQTVEPPIVLSVGDVANSYLRVPTLKDKMQSSKKEIELYCLEDLGLTEDDAIEMNDCVLTDLFSEKIDKNCIFIEGGTPSIKARALYEMYLKERFRL